MRYADAEGEWDGAKGKAMEGARAVVEGLLARSRSRWSLEVVGEREWVRGGVLVEGGLGMGGEDGEDG